MRTSAQGKQTIIKYPKKYACAYAHKRPSSWEMREGNVAVNLSISSGVVSSIKGFVATNRRKGRKDVSELTENLWIGYLRRKGVKLPPLFKNGSPAK